MENEIKAPMLSILNYCTELSKLDSEGKVIEVGNSVITVNPSGFYGRCFLYVYARKPELLTPDDIKADIDTAKSYGVHAISYTEELMPEGTDKVLEEAGFFKFITQTGMVFDEDMPFESGRDPRITTVETSDIDVWQDALIKGFGPEKPRENGVFELLSTHPDIKFYAYMENGEILGTSVLHMFKNNSGIHEVSVAPEARRKGIASKLVLRMLTDMKEDDFYGASLQASDLGYFVYEKIGFKPISKIHTFMLK